MHRNSVLIWSSLLPFNLLVCCNLRATAAADEPLPAPKVPTQEVPVPAPNARRQEEPLPTPNASRQEVPRGVVNLATPKQPDLSPEAKAAAAKANANAKTKGRKPLVAPPGLLSQAPRFRSVTAPGLGKLDLNRATLEQIQRLPGVGETWAPRILAGRPYSTLGDLARIGIPFTTIDALSGVVELGP